MYACTLYRYHYSCSHNYDRLLTFPPTHPPTHAGDSPYHSDGSLSPILLSSNSLQSHNPSPRNSASLPNHGRNSIPTSISLNAVSHTHLSPEITRRSQSPDVNTLSPNVIRRTSSGGRAAKNKFRLSGSHLMNLFTPNSSPRSSPIGRRKIFSRNNSIESEYVHWWMEDTPTTEVRHWQQVMDKDGEWVYFWHLIRPNLKSANWTNLIFAYHSFCTQLSNYFYAHWVFIYKLLFCW